MKILVEVPDKTVKVCVKSYVETGKNNCVFASDGEVVYTGDKLQSMIVKGEEDEISV